MSTSEDTGRDDRVDAYRLLIADVYELAGLSRATSEAIAREAGGQTVARWHVMSVLWEEPLPVPRIARRLGLTRQSVRRVVDDLATSGHVKLQSNPAHRRSALVELTTGGRASLRDVNSVARIKRAEQLDRAEVTVAQLREARGTIRTVIAAISA